jgi:hypothetical protein
MPAEMRSTRSRMPASYALRSMRIEADCDDWEATCGQPLTT